MGPLLPSDARVLILCQIAFPNLGLRECFCQQKVCSSNSGKLGGAELFVRSLTQLPALSCNFFWAPLSSWHSRPPEEESRNSNNDEGFPID